MKSVSFLWMERINDWWKQVLGKTYARVATVVKDASDYSYCSINEINYLKENGYYNWQNVKLAQVNCGYNTFNNTTSLSLVTNMG